jgi:outer membrane protein assembly factor BamB
MMKSTDWHLIHFSTSGNLVLTQCENNIVQCVSIETGESVWEGELDRPTAVTTDSSGLVYVATGGVSKKVTLTVLSPDTGMLSYNTLHVLYRSIHSL